MAGRARANKAAGEGIEDRSWQRWAACKVCGRRVCINNNSLREVRPPRKLGVVCCPWCSERAVQLYLVTKTLAMLDLKTEEGLKMAKKVRKVARKVLQVHDA